jgi:hypothetical protein
MEILLQKDLLKLAGWKSADEAKAELYEDGEGGEQQPRPDAPLIYARAVMAQQKVRTDEQYNRGIREKATAIENRAKPLFQQFGVTADKIEDGLTELAEKLQAAMNEKKSIAELTPEEVQAHPIFHQVFSTKVNEALHAAKAKEAELLAQFEQFKAEVSEKERRKAVTSHVRRALSTANAVFGKDQDAQIDLLMHRLDISAIQNLDSNDPELVGADGVSLINPATRLPYTFDEYVREQWERCGWGFSDTQSPAPYTTPGQTGKGSHFTSSKDAVDAAYKERDPVKKSELQRLAAQLAAKGK